MTTINDILAHADSTIMTALKADATVSYKDAATSTLRPGLDAIVEYDGGPAPVNKHLPTGQARILVTLNNDATTGVSLADDGPIIGDAILVPPAPGVTAKWCRILKRIQASDTLVTWEVR